MATSAASAGTVVEHRRRSELLQRHAPADPARDPINVIATHVRAPRDRQAPPANGDVRDELDDTPMCISSRNDGSASLPVKALDR